MKDRKRSVLAIVLCIALCVSSYSVVGVSAETSTQQGENAEPAVVEGSLLVTFDEDVTEKKAEAAAEKVDGELVGPIYEETDLALIEIDEDDDADKAMEKLEKLPQVEAVQPNYIYYADEETAGEAETEGAAASKYDMWHLDYMQVQKAWDLIDTIRPKAERTEEDKVKVAILDTGIERHEDLAANIDWENSVTVIETEQKIEEEPLIIAEGDDMQETTTGPVVVPEYSSYDKPVAQHGTYVAGLIAATSFNGFGTAGVAAGNHNDLIELMGIKVFRDGAYTNGQASATTLDIIMGLQYACDKGAKVINMCLGHEPGTMDATGGFHDDILLENEVNKAVTEYDVVITCSAGNKKDMRTWYPSDFDNVVSVINTQQYSNAWVSDVKYPSSSYGPKKDVSAPGAYVYTTNKTKAYRSGTGTSYATSCAAGVVALVRYVAPELTASQVKEILYSTATDLYTDGYDVYTGYGNLNAYKAVAQAAGVTLPENTEKMQGTTVTTKSAGTKKIELNWEIVEDSNGYYVYRSTSRNGVYEKIAHITDSKTTSYLDSGRTFNKKYYYVVEVLGTSETTKEKIKSDMSKPVLGKAVTDIPELSISRVNSYSLKLSWGRASGANGYRIFRSTTKNGTYNKVKTITKGTTTSWTDKDCTPGKKYYYKIRAYRNSGGSKVWSTMSDYSYKKAQPVKVKSFKVVKKGKKAKLSWKKHATVSGYRIYRSVSNSGTWKQVKNIKKNTRTTHTTKKLSKGKVYSYKIRPYVIVNGKTVYGAYSPVKSIIR